MSTTGTTPYTGTTASMQTDPEARHRGDGASVSSFRRFPIEDARCANSPIDAEWVPTQEQSLIPEPMAALCRRCPGRQACLSWALVGGEVGYWAGTTTADRNQMHRLAQDSVETADWLQELARREAFDGAQHPTGDGNYWWYRRRECRCAECKTANAQQRARERARTAQRATT